MIPDLLKSNRTIQRAGFTLIETMLAMVLGTLVLGGCVGVFLSLRNMDRTFENRFQRTSELSMTQSIITRAMLSIQIDETVVNTVRRAGDEDENIIDADAEPDSRDRIILQTDFTAPEDMSGWRPQRLELVTAIAPAPSSLASSSASWFLAQDQQDSLDFSVNDGTEGAVRGVFELRPNGYRELMMHRLGLLSEGHPFLTQSGLTPTILKSGDPSLIPSDDIPRWTLWWRPILSVEGYQLRVGGQPIPDTGGSTQEIQQRLSGAIPLLRDIERCNWEFYKSDELISVFQGSLIDDIPAFVQFEAILANSQYASWMFEIDWVFGDDPNTEDSDDLDGDGVPDNNTGSNGSNNRPGTNDANNNGNNNGRPGGRPGINSNSTNSFND